MATKNTKLSVAATESVTTPLRVKKARSANRLPAFSLKQKFDLISFIKEADPKTPDVALADQASLRFNRKILVATVRDYRKQFDIKSVPTPTVSQLMLYIDFLGVTIRALGGEVPPMAD